ncbi:MAG: hypothetical protein IT193_14710 [Propionibacteriaceae bacterium]|nr:hypothetical protein [Propionibacteriaceae bacterium]
MIPAVRPAAADLSAHSALSRSPARGRVLLVALGGAALLSGLDAALVRLEVWAPVASDRLGDVHGQVMVLGFLATLISLERAQALGRAWAFLAPALFGAGALALISSAAPLLGELLQVEGAILFVATYVALWRRAPRALVAVQVLSGVLALGGAVVVTFAGPSGALPWLAGFVIVTIAAERAELAALTMGERADRELLALASTLTLSVLAALVFPSIGERLLGVTVAAIAAWLAVHDVARRQLRLTGQRRYIATALLAGYVNLLIAGLVLTIAGLRMSTATYDVVVHGVFLGFAVSMVMAHAPVILPAVLGRPLPYRPALWVPLVLLHVSLGVRFTGALSGQSQLWQAGGVLGVLAMLAFLATAVTLVVRR